MTALVQRSDRPLRAELSCLLLALVAVCAHASCSQDVPPPQIRDLDGPTAVAYGCYGDLRVNGGDPNADSEITVSAQPVSSCARTEVPAGQEDLIGPSLFAFVLQSTPGTVAVVGVNFQTGSRVVDSDPLTPGRNAIPIGTLPVGIASDESECFLATANAGSCDLSILDINSAIDSFSGAATIARVDVTNASGEKLQAKPRAIIGPERTDTIGLACPDTAGGTFYIAYPECHIVAAVDAGTGAVLAGLQFATDGTVSITDGNVSCPSQCGTGIAAFEALANAEPGTSAADDGAERPVVLAKVPDGSRLLIGAENSPVVSIVTLDENALPLSVDRVTLEGDVGVSELAASDEIAMGGDTGLIGGSAGTFQFAYAVVSDGTIRVLSIGGGPGTAVECDTQVDPRYLHDERDVAFLSCMPVGDAATPPRRPGARSPGIEVDGVPLSVAITRIEPPPTQDASGALAPTPILGDPAPTSMVGTFAFVTTSTGFVFIVNVDDDKYPDFEVTDDPAKVSMPLALPHQLRDFIRDRDEIALGACGFDSAPDPFVKGPRTAAPTNLVISLESVLFEQSHQLPGQRGVSCQNELDDNMTTTAVSELHFAADPTSRDLAFPDLAAVRNEEWFFTWEGVVSIDPPNVSVDGPPVRSGFFEQDVDETRLVDGSAPFCAAGVRPFDIAQIIGCNPTRGDSQCGIGEVCFVHPESPANVTNGTCIDASREEELAQACRAFMISRRRYSVTETEANRLLIHERRRVLRTSPLDGCTDAAQCDLMYEVEQRLTDGAHPLDRQPLPSEGPPPTWACESDPSRAPGPARCVMTCESSGDCGDGFACSGGYCVEGLLPPRECIGSVQQYALRVGDAFAVLGERSGFLHRRKVDTMTGACVNDPDASPLNVARIPLRAPACQGEGLLAMTPNPCSTTVDHTEQFGHFDSSAGQCELIGVELRTRQAPAIRFTNSVFSFHVVDTESSGDAECRADVAGELPPHSGVYPGYGFNFEIHGGFVPMFLDEMTPALPSEIVVGPTGRLWVLDSGDISSVIKGQVFVVSPEYSGDDAASPPIRFGVQTIR